MKRIGLFMEVSNLYHSIARQHKDRKLDYRKYYEFVADLGEIQQAIAYGAQRNHEAAKFITCLKDAGYMTRFREPKEFADGTKKANWDVGMTVDMIRMVDSLDMIVLGSADGDFAELVNYVIAKGKQVVVLACDISYELKDVATKCIEIPLSLLEEKR